MNPSICWFDPQEFAELARSAQAEVTPAAAPAEPAAKPRFRPAAGSLDARVADLLAWLRRREPSLLGLFVTDADGLPVASLDARADHVAVSAALMATLTRVRDDLNADARRIAVTIQPGEVLHVATVDTTVGTLAVGMVAPDRLSDAFLGEARAALALITQTIGVDHG